MRALRLIALLIFACSAGFALPPANPARAAPVAAGSLVPSASPEAGGLIQPVYWRRHYWHRTYSHRHYYHRSYWHRPVRWHRRVYWRPHYYHRTYYRRTYWRPRYRRHYWHRRYWW
jgi:hypothetical protein